LGTHSTYISSTGAVVDVKVNDVTVNGVSQNYEYKVIIIQVMKKEISAEIIMPGYQLKQT